MANEAVVRQESFGQMVLSRRQKIGGYRAHAAIAQDSQDGLEKRALGLTSDYAARHQQGVDLGLGGRGLSREDDSDKAAVAEDVGQREMRDEPVRCIDETADVGLGVSPGRQVELVRLLRELRDARERRRVERVGPPRDLALLFDRR